MMPLYCDPHFTFRFADDRIIPRFHLDGAEVGQRVSVFKLDPATGDRLGLIVTATVGADGWVDLPEPIIVRAGSGFVVVPMPASDASSTRSRSGLVLLRDVQRADLRQIYDLQLDPESNRMAVTIPRSAEAFATHWDMILRDPNLIAKAIVFDGVLVGTISCFKMDGVDSVGYWIGRSCWGKGIATRALELLLETVAIRPLHAHVATSNAASLRVLQKCGFVVERTQLSPASDRFPECEEAVLVLT